MAARISRATAVSLLLLMLFLAGGAAVRESATVDEVAHVGAGLSYLQRLDLRLNPEHPPLAKILAAIPLAIRGTLADYSSPSWRLSSDFFPAYFSQWIFGDSVLGRWNPWRPVLFWARAPMLALTLLLGWMVYSYARRLGGSQGGLLCLAIYVTTPAVLVFGPLVLTDLAVTMFLLIAHWQLGEIWTSPSPAGIRRFGLATGAALLSKFTALLIIVTVAVLMLHTRFWPSAAEPKDSQARKVWRNARWRGVFQGILWAIAVVYVTYFILSLNQPDEALNRLGGGSWAWVIRRPLMPVWLYLRGLLLMLLTSSRPVFLLGHTYPHGVPFYFPVVFVLKSTLGSLLLLIMAAGSGVACRRLGVRVIPDKFSGHWRVLTTGLFVFTAACLASRLNISIRHFLFPTVVVTLMLAPLPRMISSLPRPRVMRVLMLTAAAMCFVPVLAAYPFFFPFVNSLAFGRPAYSLLNDSNVSWNEGLPEVDRFVREQRLKEIAIDWAGLSDAALVVPQARAWDCQKPTDQELGHWVVVAAVSILENHNCGYLLQYPRRELAGGSFHAFHLPASLPPPGMSGGPPLDRDRKILWGVRLDLRNWALQIEHHPEGLGAALQNLMQAFRQGAQNSQ